MRWRSGFQLTHGHTPRNERRDGVDGFTALEDYSAAFAESESPPAPMVFYNVVEAADAVDSVQYWMYSVFDSFTVNVHWHDWELIQVFVDRESDTPLLVSASAHARMMLRFRNSRYLAEREDGDAGGRVRERVSIGIESADSAATAAQRGDSETANERHRDVRSALRSAADLLSMLNRTVTATTQQWRWSHA